jgi:hypothetical protein
VPFSINVAVPKGRLRIEGQMLRTFDDVGDRASLCSGLLRESRLVDRALFRRDTYLFRVDPPLAGFAIPS